MIEPIFSSERVKRHGDGRQWLIVDKDGTLANCDHRVHLARAREWDQFNEAMGLDTPNPAVVKIVESLRSHGLFISVCTGASDAYATLTMRWLTDHGIPFDELRMRPAADLRHDYVVKMDMVPPDRNVLFVLEDRDRVVQAWRERGFTCLQVAPGGY